MKVSIVGAGRVGAALGLALVVAEAVDEIALIGRNRAHVEAEALDLMDAAALGRPVMVRGGLLEVSEGSDVVVIATGGTVEDPHKALDRSAWIAVNAPILAEIVPAIANLSPNAVLVVVTNPVEPMTALTLELSGFHSDRVLGLGTLLDTMRLRGALGRRLEVRPSDIRVYVLGEHGDRQFATFSSASVGAGRLDLTGDDALSIEQAVRTRGQQIIRGKGFTAQGIALATAAVINAIARDLREVMPLSVSTEGVAGIRDVVLSLPVVIGKQGVVRRLPPNLSVEETHKLHVAAEAVRAMTDRLVGLREEGADEPSSTTP